MTIEDLHAGQKVTLQVTLGESSFEINTEVVGTNAGTGILVKPYVYKDNIVDFSISAAKDMTFTLHVADSETGTRLAWKNVSLKMVNYKGISYYAIDSKAFGSIAASSERRETNRIKLYVSGQASFEGIKLPVSMFDISDSGVAFTSSQSQLLTIGDRVVVNFTDIAHETDFNMTLYIRIVRVEENENSTFYAGRILDPDKKLLAYLCFKRMEDKASKKTYAKGSKSGFYSG